MTPDEETILRLTRENSSLRAKLKERENSILQAERKMSVVGIPHGFEDGNSWDDLDFDERISLLCEWYKQLEDEKKNK